MRILFFFMLNLLSLSIILLMILIFMSDTSDTKSLIHLFFKEVTIFHT